MADILAAPHVSSPGGAASRRLSLGVAARLTNTNDAEEQRERRKSLLLQNKHLSSPSTPNRSSSLQVSYNPLKDLSVSQVADHYTNCVKLNAENKINSKNAFGLHLIDYMTDLMQKEKFRDFQVAGTTIDASAKIYASRVDAVHSDTYRVLSTLSRGYKKKGKDGGGDNDDDGGNDDDEDDGNNDDDDAASSNSKNSKKERKEKKTKVLDQIIAADGKSINLDKHDVDFQMDPVFKSLTTAYAEGQGSGLMLSAISSHTDSCQLVLSTATLTDIESSKCSSSHTNIVDIDNVNSPREKIDQSDAQICPEFTSFKFSDWNENDESVVRSIGNKPNYEFDINAEHENIPAGFDDVDDEDDDGGGDGDFFGGDNDMEEENVGIAGGHARGDGGALSLTGPGFLTKSIANSTNSVVDFLSKAPSEYSFFSSKMLQTWKGPNHWKNHPCARLKPKNSTSRSVQKKEKFFLDFSVERNFSEEFRKARSCVLTAKKLESWTTENTTLPPILEYKASDLFSAFLKAGVLIRRSDKSTVNDDLVGDYDYDNCNDKENYCPAYDQTGGDDNCDDTSEDMFGYSNSSQQSDVNATMFGTQISTLDGSRLVAQPHKVTKINIDYARTAKKIDMRLLKESMWKLMCSFKDEDKENQSNNVSNAPKSISGVLYFTDVIKKLPPTLPRFMSSSITVPIAFACLLQLANEKELGLKSIAMEDIEICLPAAVTH
ncbi:condensin complex subunit 2-like [Argonauta hians]